MHKETFSLGFACAIGAFIGALSALEIAARFALGGYLWAFGAFAGGLVAYIAVDFREFYAGVKRAYRRTIAWRPNGLFWKSFGIAFAGGAMMAGTVSGAVSLCLFPWLNSPATTVMMFHVIYALAMGVFLGSCLTLGDGSSYGPVQTKEERLLEAREKGLWMLIHVNPISAVFYTVKAVLLFLGCLLLACATCVIEAQSEYRQMRAFLIQAFIYVHSARRTICFVDATIGAAAGYYFGSAVLGAVIGAILGAVNYELVSVRWLKLIPARAKAE